MIFFPAQKGGGRWLLSQALLFLNCISVSFHQQKFLNVMCPPQPLAQCDSGKEIWAFKKKKKKKAQRATFSGI